MRDRSWRRAQRARVIKRTAHWLRSQGWFTDPFIRWSERDGEIAIRQRATTPQPCSSYCCGNPRKWFDELTWQERRISITEAEFRDDINQTQK
jgi:hypothetical protein